MNTVTNPEVIAALEEIAARRGGILHPADVVEAAREPQSPLHSHFTWDDDKAAEAHRLWEARQLIRVTVKMLDLGGKREPVRVFVSLTPDRRDGGYRTVAAVLSRKETRDQLLTDALAELRTFERKYGALKELAGVHREAAKALRRFEQEAAA